MIDSLSHHAGGFWKKPLYCPTSAQGVAFRYKTTQNKNTRKQGILISRMDRLAVGKGVKKSEKSCKKILTGGADSAKLESSPKTKL